MVKAILLDAGGVLYLNEGGIGQINLPLLRFIQNNQHRYLFGVISTTTFDLENILTKHNIRNLFSVVLTTGKEGLDKARPEIYQLAMKKLNILPQEAIFIDNNEVYVRIAQGVGINAVLYTTSENLEKYLNENLPLS